MRVTTTPNVRDVLRADPMAAIVVEAFQRDAREGYLHLYRSSRTGPFDAIYYGPDLERRSGRSTDLLDAIAGALGEVA